MDSWIVCGKYDLGQIVFVWRYLHVYRQINLVIRVSRKYAICLDMLGLLLIFVSPCDSRYSSSAFVWHVLSCADHDDNDDGPQVCPESFGLNMAPNRHRLRSRIVKATWWKLPSACRLLRCHILRVFSNMFSWGYSLPIFLWYSVRKFWV